MGDVDEVDRPPAKNPPTMEEGAPSGADPAPGLLLVVPPPAVEIEADAPAGPTPVLLLKLLTAFSADVELPPICF